MTVLWQLYDPRYNLFKNHPFSFISLSASYRLGMILLEIENLLVRQTLEHRFAAAKAVLASG